MYCKNCGGFLNQGSVVCTSCGVPAGVGKNFCPNCGVNINEFAVICVKCGCPLTNQLTNQYSTQANIRPTNGKAIASFVLGILSVVSCGYTGFLGIIGIILAAFAKKEINQRGENGGGLATAGLVMSIIGVALFLFIACILILTLVVASYKN
jgi:uncharacterized membrane protein YvbJ